MSDRQEFNQQRRELWDKQWNTRKRYDGFSRAYHSRLHEIYRHNVLTGSRILELGCGNGDLLASLSPGYGLGVDFSGRAIEVAKENHPHLEFRQCDAHEIDGIDGPFDYIILSDLINDLYDIELVLRQLKNLCNSNTRILINFYSRLWAGILSLGQKAGMANRLRQQNWLTRTDMSNLLTLTGFETIRNCEEVILPAEIPLVSTLANRTLPKLWPFNHLALTHFFVARALTEAPAESLDSVSIIIAARNEAGHIDRLVREIPKLGSETEVIFVEGGSQDDTHAKIAASIDARDDIRISLHRQPEQGKADAVRLGFDLAKNDVLMILDADISVIPSDLERFFLAITEGKGEFINGVRLVYPMQDQAMRLLNLLGNKFFSYGFQFTLGQPVKDTLCGTKVISKLNYQRLVRNRHYFGDFDPYGDFDLLFGAAKLNLKIVDIPVRYQARTYGETNINRWSGGFLLLKMLARGMKTLKFI